MQINSYINASVRRYLAKWKINNMDFIGVSVYVLLGERSNFKSFHKNTMGGKLSKNHERRIIVPNLARLRFAFAIKIQWLAIAWVDVVVTFGE